MHLTSNLKLIPLLGLCVILPSGVVFTQEINTAGNDSVKLRQQIADTNLINKEMPDGYTVRLMRDITGSVSIVESARLSALPSGIVNNLLQGQASGVTVTGSGQPGEASKVRIRGSSSFLSNEPLYIIDGVPTQDITSINPYDVASVSVLKDAGAASIYGSRASNGVIILTTKRGIKGIRITYDMAVGIQQPGKGTKPDVLDTDKYAELQWKVYKNDGTVETHPIYGSSQNPAPSIPSWAANTDWYDAVTDAAGIQNHNLSISGGSENARFYTGINAFRQNGIIIHTNNTRYSGRLNSDFHLFNKRLKAGENFNFSSRSYLNIPNLGENSPVNTGPYRSQSIIPVIITKPLSGLNHEFIPGEWGGTGIAPRLGNSGNVVADLTRRKDDKSSDTYLTGNIYLEMMIVNGLNIRSTLGGTWDKGVVKNNIYATYERSENIATTTLEENRFSRRDWVWTNTVTLDKQIGQHKILAVAGYEAVNYGVGQTISSPDTAHYTPTRMLSTFVAADYAFRDKYLISATLRRDGCSRFSESQRYGIFPSFSAGWRIGNEPFLDRLDWISDLKIRGSWGKTGNQFAVSPQNAVFLFGSSAGGSYYDLFGTFTSSVPGFYPVRTGNPDATYETNYITDIGFDASLFNNRVNLIFDWYSKKGSDLLFNAEMPGTSGVAAPPFVNIASIKNAGIEMELSYRNVWGNLGLQGSFIFSTNKNEITEIANGLDFFDSGTTRIGSLVRNKTGHSLSSFYGYQVVGLFQNPAEISDAPTQDGAEPGFLRFADIDTTSGSFHRITPGDRTFIGNPNPRFIYGLNLAITWKNLDLTAFLYGSEGNDIFNYNKWWTDFWQSFQGQKSKALLYDSWSTSNTGGTVPKASNKSNFSTNTVACSYFIENGSYLRLKNLQVGYTFPATITKKIKITSLRIYLQAINLFTLTKYSGLDPEIGGNDLAFGIDYGNYPKARQFIFGLNFAL